MGHGAVADEIKGRAPQSGGERPGAMLEITEEGVTLPLLPRRLGDGSWARRPRWRSRPRSGRTSRSCSTSARRSTSPATTPRARPSAPTAGSTAASPGTPSTGPEGQVVYGIVQGGVEEDLRRASAQEVAARPVAGSRSAARWARTRRRCTRSSTGRSPSCRRRAPAPPARDRRGRRPRSAASSSASTRSTARCRRGSAATAWRSCPTRSTRWRVDLAKARHRARRRAAARGLPVPGVRARLLARLPALPAQGARARRRAAAHDPQPRLPAAADGGAAGRDRRGAAPRRPRRCAGARRRGSSLQRLIEGRFGGAAASGPHHPSRTQPLLMFAGGAATADR